MSQNISQNIPFESGVISASQCISDAWELIKEQYWVFFGMTALGVVLLGCIPCVNIFLMGPFMVGIYMAVLFKMRGGTVSFDMLFKGFDKFLPAMILGLIESVPTIISYILRFTIDIASLGLDLNRRGGRNYDFYASRGGDMEPALAAGIIIAAIVVVIFFVLLAWAWRITFMFALPLLTEHNLPVMECIKLSARAGWSNPGGIIVLMIFQGIMMFLGVLALCIGWLFVVPIMVASNIVAYRMVFPDITPMQPQYNEPPRPDYYGSTFGNQG